MDRTPIFAGAVGPEEPASPSRLARRLGLADAVIIGLGSMVGAGVFAAIGPAALAAGNGLLAGLLLAAFAMASNRDLPSFFAAVHPRYRVPHRAELAVGLFVASAAALADFRTAIGFSSFAVLTYYAITNASALTLAPSRRLWPRWIAVCGFVGCVTLAFSLPIASVAGGSALLITGGAVYLARRRLLPA